MDVQEVSRPVRVLYSFPHKLGAGRICWTAWQQVLGLDAAGARVSAVVGQNVRRPPSTVSLFRTLGVGKLRIPYKLIGTRRAARVHDRITAFWLRLNSRRVDIVHAWPLAGLATIRMARKLGIPVLMERPNAHTAFAYRIVDEECERVGIRLPEGFEHKFDADLLAHEEKEYAECDFLLCPSDFVRRTFIDEGTPEEKLLRHQYGYDRSLIWPGNQEPKDDKGLVMIHVGICTPRKGLHHALAAWLASDACHEGKFLVCGDFVPGYREKLAEMLAHPSVQVLGHRNDVPELMRQADVFVLSSMEEGSALVTYEARGSGCVLLVSEASGAVCLHMENALVHPIRDVALLTSHINLLNKDRNLLEKLRLSSLATLDKLTWKAAGKRLLDVYQSVLRRDGSPHRTIS
ncbi:MAG: glycosyltransferase [Verrucomicrobiaceae bacterium]|nr:MAG: glycosyltransferase [Verrucomicrobiaceae bacterium]